MKKIEPHQKRSHHILIVEDDIYIRETLQMALELEGYVVRTAAEGAKGLEALNQTELPCLILLDLMMPIMNGWEFAEAVGKDSVLSQIPIAVVSAFAEKASKIPAKAVINKPIDMDLLLKIVQECCG